MIDIIQTVTVVALAATGVGLLIYRLRQRGQLIESSEQLDNSYRSLYDALGQLTHVMRPEEREGRSTTNTREDGPLRETIKEVNALFLDANTRRVTQPDAPTGFGSDVFQPVPDAQWRACPACGTITSISVAGSEVGAVTQDVRMAVARMAGDLTILVGQTHNDRYSAEPYLTSEYGNNPHNHVSVYGKERYGGGVYVYGSRPVTQWERATLTRMRPGTPSQTRRSPV